MFKSRPLAYNSICKWFCIVIQQGNTVFPFKCLIYKVLSNTELLNHDMKIHLNHANIKIRFRITLPHHVYICNLPFSTWGPIMRLFQIQSQSGAARIRASIALRMKEKGHLKYLQLLFWGRGTAMILDARSLIHQNLLSSARVLKINLGYKVFKN